MYRTDTATSAPEAQNNAAKPRAGGSWYLQVARAWGSALNRQADKTVALAESLTQGDNGPGVALQVSAASHQLAFLSTAASTASNSIGQALETLGRKQ